MSILPSSDLKDTSLWKRLKNSFNGHNNDIAEVMAAHLETICAEARDRMRSFPSLHPEYTLHDEVHLLRVTDLMSRIIPESVADRLNPVEIMLLILSAHFHDQGMVLERPEIDSLTSNEKYLIFRDNWEIEHPNIKDVKQRLHDRNLSDAELDRCRSAEHDLSAAMLTDFVRTTHGERSARFVRDRYGADPRWNISGTNISALVAHVCESHVRPTTDLTSSNGFRTDEVVGIYKVNVAYIAVILRLADILDFDRDRTPDSLYRTIHFRSDVSLREWEKHRSVKGWVIEPTLVQFTMLCEHPEYQRAAYQFMDWIDAELGAAQSVCRNFPAMGREYVIDLPVSVDRTRIEPKDNSYIYYDLEFSLSRDEVVKLLMMEGLYGNKSLCVRELLQNSLDALRHRRSLFCISHLDWTDGSIEMTHELDAAGHEVLRCIDNGVGMDRPIIERFLTNAGRSYYRSPEFEQERASFRAAGLDFDPCAQFGIGFMSCFMLGDRITIKTRKDYGPARGHGEPLVVEIRGLSGIVVVRTGLPHQAVGTTVEIVGRKKPGMLDEFEDQVRLIAVLDGYALATEFPITGVCSVPELSDSIEIPAQVSVPISPLETVSSSVITVSQPFSEVDPRLNGYLVAGFLVNHAGQLVLENADAKWEQSEPNQSAPQGRQWSRLTVNGNTTSDALSLSGVDRGQTCLDGILVAGEPGRDPSRTTKTKYLLGSNGNPIQCAMLHKFLLDVRGSIKPPLTPARLPPDRWFAFNQSPKWEHIQSLVSRAEGKLWEKAIFSSGSALDPEMLFVLALIYGCSLHWMSFGTIWSAVSVPIIRDKGAGEWCRISDLNIVNPKAVQEERGSSGANFALAHSANGYIGATPELGRWLSSDFDDSNYWAIRVLVAAMGTVTLTQDAPCFKLLAPDHPDKSPGEFLFSQMFDLPLVAIAYAGDCSQYVSVHMPCRCVNRDHPVVQQALAWRYVEQRAAIQTFIGSLVWCISNIETSAFVTNPEKRVDRWRKSVGSAYADVEWAEISDSLHPPYLFRSIDGSDVAVTDEVLLRWAHSVLPAEE